MYIASTYLNYKSTNKDTHKYWVPKDAFEYIPLPVNHTRVDFIEQLHHNKRVENDGRVTCWFAPCGWFKAKLNIKQIMTFED